MKAPVMIGTCQIIISNLISLQYLQYCIIYSFISCVKITSAMGDHVLGFKPSAGAFKADHEDEEGGNHKDNT